MEYQVPQFIDVEDKIFGPLTWRQFVFVGGGAGICVTLFLTLHTIGVIIAIPIGIFALALAFYKVNNKTFLEILEAGFNYYLGSRLYLWKKAPPKEIPQQPVAPAPRPSKLGLSESKLRDLAWALDIKDTQSPDAGE